MLLLAADEGHLLKNTWGQLLCTNFALPADVVEKNKLPSNVVDIGHVQNMPKVLRVDQT